MTVVTLELYESSLRCSECRREWNSSARARWIVVLGQMYCPKCGRKRIRKETGDA